MKSLRVAFVLGTLACFLALGFPLAESADKAPAPSVSTPIGFCTEDLEGAKAAGFDYVELGVRDFVKLTDEEFAGLIRRRDRVGIKTPTAYVFLPNEMRIVGPAVDDALVMAYVEKAFKRAHVLGIELIVVGSGPARRVPDGFPKEKAFAQLVSFAKRISPLARREGIVLGVEAQRKEETNIINSMQEALVWIEAVNDPNFQLIADIYHVAESKEDPAVILKSGARLRHVHFANPIGRAFPASAQDYDYSTFFENLRKIGYRGRISIEARTTDLGVDGPKAIAFLRGAMANGVSRPKGAALR